MVVPKFFSASLKDRFSDGCFLILGLLLIIFIYSNLIIYGSFITVQKFYFLILIIIWTVPLPFVPAYSYEAQEWKIILK